jgi:hypothetical protein
MTSLQQAPAGLPETGRYLLRPATPGELVTVRAFVLDVPAPDGTGPATVSRAAAD